MSVGYIPGGMNTSDALTKAMYSANLGNLLNGNSSRIVTEIQKNEIRKRLPASQRYIVYRETTQGRKDLHIDMRRKTRAGGMFTLGNIDRRRASS